MVSTFSLAIKMVGLECSKLIPTCPIYQKFADFSSVRIQKFQIFPSGRFHPWAFLWLVESVNYQLETFFSSFHDHFNFNVLISTNESLMLFTVTVPGGPGPTPNSGKVMGHMTTNPIIKMDKRWSLLSNKGSLPHSPSTTTHTFFDIKAEFCPLSLVHQNSPLSIVSGSTCGSVLFFSSLSDRPINILQGHERGVLVATFNYDESLLGNCFSFISGLYGRIHWVVKRRFTRQIEKQTKPLRMKRVLLLYGKDNYH